MIFTCTLCGECCSGDMKVFLNSYDLYRMAQFHNMAETGELFDRNLVMMEEGQNGLLLPRIRFKSNPYPFCPFLINDFSEEKGLRGLCSLHPDHKPLVCRLAPLTRTLDLDSREEQFDFIPPHPGCPGCGRGDRLNPEVIGKEMREELDFEMRYFRLLRQCARQREEIPDRLFRFSVSRRFEEILGDWENRG